MKSRFPHHVLLLSALWLLTSCGHRTEPRRIVGIFGGMGPEATANFYSEIVRLTPAKKDQDHLPVLIYSLPQVPDRSTCIASGSREIVPYITQAVRKLERGGASFIAIPCNTVHYYHADMQRAVRIPVLNMITETADAVLREQPQARTVGLLATNGTVRAKLYENEFTKRGLKVLLLPETLQQCCVMDAVYSIKSGGSKQKQADLLARAGEDLIRRGADVLVLGCTEIPLAFDVKRSRVPVVNATQVLARAAIREHQKGGTR
ncbi:MAG TPA: aspartate racemase [Verrucomicrobiales bacterium]|nr:aspartate racemase [Verrucomicrobiales bacterium]